MTIGVIPAAGSAVRIQGIPKMLLPTPDETLAQRLVRAMDRTLPRRIRIGTTPRYFEMLWSHLDDDAGCSVFSVTTASMSETVLAARPYADPDERVLLGMPDTYFEDMDAFVKLADELDDGAEVAVGVFQTCPEQRNKLGMVEIAGCEVLHVYDKPVETDLTWAWGVLAWKPKFWNLIYPSDPHVGYALPRALAAEMDVRAVRMNGGYWDCGTVEGYFDLIGHLQAQKAGA